MIRESLTHFPKIIGIIGAGRVGGTFAFNLKDLCELVIFDTDRSKLVSLENFLERPLNHEPSQLRLCRLIMICVQDRALSEVAVWLKSESLIGSNTTVIHTSGSALLETLSILKSPSVSLGSAHPLMAFPSSWNKTTNFRGSWFAVNGCEKALEILETFISGLGAKCFRIEDSNRIAYHCSAVFASNFLNMLLEIASEHLQTSGIPEQTVRSALSSLARTAINNFETHSATQALSGPVVRGDLETVRLHLVNLAISKGKGLPVYTCLTRLILQVCREGRLFNEEKLLEFEKILDSYEN